MFSALKIFKENLNMMKTETVQAVKGMKNEANLRYCHGPEDTREAGMTRSACCLGLAPGAGGPPR